ncbi:MAG: histidine--tRNA ligase [Candidatus Omnitrophota bacterium]
MSGRMRIKALRGMSDILPSEAEEWQRIERVAREVFRSFRYRMISTPILEETELFVGAIGGDTDIVTKEMFSFEDRGKRSVTMRPEGTAPVIRAYLEAKYHVTEAFQKLFYVGPMFRAERPQAGRSRQFHQIGVEAIGSPDPLVDAEVIVLLARVLDAIGITGYRIRINNLGCVDDKKRLSNYLKGVFQDQLNVLCDDCKIRVERNPLRVLDCKKESCRTIVRSSFKSDEYLCADCVRHFSEVITCLDSLKIPYLIDSSIVRGLDYYTKTVFEVTHADLGSQDAIGAGGRYDNLVAKFGGPDLGACGFALGIERMIVALKRGATEREPGPDIYFVCLGKESRSSALIMASRLREERITCDIRFEERSLKAQMRTADRSGARFVAILGENELKKGAFALRNMTTKNQTELPIDGYLPEIKKAIAR